MIERIQELKDQFGAITGTGYTPPNGYLTEFQAREWLSAGFTLDDLRILVRHRRKVTEEPFLSNMLKWSFLIGRLDRFSEDLAQAKAAFRNHRAKPTNKEKILSCTGRTSAVEKPARTAGQVMSEAGLAAFEELKKLRQQLEKS